LGEAAVAAAGFLLGSAPMLLYNIEHPLATFRAGEEIARASHHAVLWKAAAQRLGILRDLLEGETGKFLLGGEFQKASLFRGSLAPGALYFVPLLLAAALLLRPFSDRRRVIGFLAAVSFFLLLSLAAVPFAAGPHHVIALYPFPQLFLGVGLAALWQAGASFRKGICFALRG